MKRIIIRKLIRGTCHLDRYISLVKTRLAMVYDDWVPIDLEEETYVKRNIMLRYNNRLDAWVPLIGGIDEDKVEEYTALMQLILQQSAEGGLEVAMELLDEHCFNE